MERFVLFSLLPEDETGTAGKARLLQGLALLLTASAILYNAVTLPRAELWPILLAQSLVSLVIVAVTFSLIRYGRIRLATHFFFTTQTAAHLAVLFTSGISGISYLLLSLLVAVTILDPRAVTLLYGVVSLTAVTIFTAIAPGLETGFLLRYYLLALTLGLTTWFAAINLLRALQHAQASTVALQEAAQSAAQKSAELTRLSQESAAAGVISQRRAQQLQTSAEIGQIINTERDLDALLRTATEMIRTEFGFYFVAVYLLDENGERLTLREGTGEAGTTMKNGRFSLPLQTNSIICWVARNHQMRIAHDVRQDPAYLAVPQLAQTESEVALPLMVRGTLLGVLDVQSSEVNAFAEEDLAFLQILANQLAGSIENAQVFAQTEARLNENLILNNLNTLLTSTLDVPEIHRRGALAFAEYLRAARVTLYTWDPQQNTLTREITFWRGTDDHGAGSYTLEQQRLTLEAHDNRQRVLQTLEPLVYYRTDLTQPEFCRTKLQELQAESCLLLPMVQGTEAVGILELLREERDGRFQPRELQLAQTMANQLTLARQNAQSVSESRAKVAQLSTINRLSTILSLSPTLEDVFEGARSEIFALIEATGMSILLLTPEKTHLNWLYGYERGAKVDLSGIPPLPITQGFSGHVVRTQQVLHINRQMEEMRAQFQSLTVGALPSSWLGLPMIVANQLIGVLAVENEYDSDAFSEQDVALLKIITGPMAIAINNLLQLRAVEEALASQSRQRIQLQTAAEVAAAASSILDRQELIARAVTLIKERFDLYYAGLFLLDEKREYAVLQAGSGEAGRIQVAKGHRLAVGGRSLVGGTCADGRVRLTQDVTRDSEWRPNPVLPLTQAELVLPLKVRGLIIGALTVQSTQANVFDPSLVGTLQIMADQLAVAIENARLLADAETRARQQRLLNEISTQMHRTTDISEIIRTGLQAISEQLGGAPVTLRLGGEAAEQPAALTSLTEEVR